MHIVRPNLKSFHRRSKILRVLNIHFFITSVIVQGSSKDRMENSIRNSRFDIYGLLQRLQVYTTYVLYLSVRGAMLHAAYAGSFFLVVCELQLKKTT